MSEEIEEISVVETTEAVGAGVTPVADKVFVFVSSSFLLIDYDETKTLP